MVTKRQRTAQRRFRRVAEFLTTNTVEGTDVKLQVLNGVIDGIEAGGEEHDASTRVTLGETKRQKALRDALRRQHMVPLSRIARRVFGVPGMDVKFQLPPFRADNEAMLSAARGMAQAAEQHAKVFQQEGLPADFLAKFRSAIDDLAGVLTVKVEGQRRRKTSKESLEKLVKRGIAAVDVLDAIVKPRLEAQPDLLETWNSVKRPIDVGGGAPAAVEVPQITPVVKVA
jgi:hypothetical protein